MVIVLFAAIVGGVVFYVRFKEYLKIKNKTEETLEANRFEFFDFSKPFSALFLLFILFGAGSALFGAFQKDETTAAIGLIVTLIFIPELLCSKARYSMYYNDRCFLTNGNLVYYKNIKEYDITRNIPFAFKKIVQYNGEKIPVSPKCFDIINQKVQLLKKK